MIHDWATAGKANTNEDSEFTGLPFDIDGSEEAWAFLKTKSLLGSDDPDDMVPMDPGTGGDSGGMGTGGDTSSGGASLGAGGGAATGGTATAAGGSSDVVSPPGSGGATDLATEEGGDATEEANDASAEGCSCKMGERGGNSTTGGLLALFASLGWLIRFSGGRKVRSELNQL